MSVVPGAGVTAVVATADAGSNYDIEFVRFWASGDAAYTFAGADLDKGSGVWSKLVPVVVDPATAIYFVDVQYKTKDLFPTRFSLSSVPSIPAGQIPNIRGMDNCQ